jgi:hypothetical protein
MIVRIAFVDGSIKEYEIAMKNASRLKLLARIRYASGMLVAQRIIWNPTTKEIIGRITNDVILNINNVISIELVSLDEGNHE